MNSPMILRSPNLAEGEVPLVVRLYEVPAFRDGGLASAAHSVRSAGRGGDDVLLHINPKEYEFLKHVWGEPSTNPHTGLPEYGLFKKLKKALKFEKFNVKGIVKDIAKNPERLLVGAVDPLGTKIANTVLGTKWKPVVNQLGGATKQRFQDAEAQGIETGTAKTLHGVAGAVAGYYGGNALGNLASEGLGSVSEQLATAAGNNPNTLDPVIAGAGQSSGSALSQAAAAGAKAAESGSQALSNLGGKAADYAKDPKNWATIAKGVGLVGGLAGAGGASGEEPGAVAPEAPTSPGLKILPFDRTRADQNFNWYTYGEGPEQSFYNYNEIPSLDGPSTQPTDPWMGGIPGSGFGSQVIGGAHGGAMRFVRGPGTGRSDSIEAKLSDGEYVLTAEDVALLGDGSSEAGARRLDEFRQNLRMHKGGALSQGKISPNAKSPMAYLKGVR